MPRLADMPAEHRAQCDAFLKELRRTANIDASARAAGVSTYAMLRRRARYPGFATRWDAALGYARAKLARGGPVTPQGASPIAASGEYTVSRGPKRWPQVRRARAGQLTEEGERAFLAQLAATANVRMASEAVGITAQTIYARRGKDPHFADRMDAALECGYERLEFELLETATASLDPSQLVDWADEAAVLPSPLLRMSYDQIVNMLGLHHKRARLKQDRCAHNRKVSRAEETDAAITALLDNLQRRGEETRARDERMAARGEENREEASMKRIGRRDQGRGAP